MTFQAHDQPVYHVACSRDGRLAASIQSGGIVKLWDVKTGEVRHTFLPGKPTGNVHLLSGAVNGLAFSPDGLRLAAAAADGRVRVWEPQRAALSSIFPTRTGMS